MISRFGAVLAGAHDDKRNKIKASLIYPAPCPLLPLLPPSSSVPPSVTRSTRACYVRGLYSFMGRIICAVALTLSLSLSLSSFLPWINRIVLHKGAFTRARSEDKKRTRLSLTRKPRVLPPPLPLLNPRISAIARDRARAIMRRGLSAIIVFAVRYSGVNAA